MPNAPRRKPTRASDSAPDLGLGGLFKGLGDLMDLIGKLAEDGEKQTERSGSVKSDDGRVVYGFSVRTGIGGVPKVERFGNVRSSDDGPVVNPVREPLIDIFDEDDAILLVAELPGVADDEITIDIQGDVFALETTGERRYAREVLLPAPVNPASIQRTYRNGILEVRLTRAAPAEEPSNG
jgi:HSP20 family protein